MSRWWIAVAISGVVIAAIYALERYLLRRCRRKKEEMERILSEGRQNLAKMVKECSSRSETVPRLMFYEIDVTCEGCGLGYRTTDIDRESKVIFSCCPKCNHPWARKTGNGR